MKDGDTFMTYRLLRLLSQQTGETALERFLTTSGAVTDA
jgi:hypothetical protein